jgi:LysR family transcriptional regulator, nod-box dependent transcriptional activator
MPNPLSRFDLNLLLALEALLAERHVTRAAERLYVSQPTMSGMLQRLREHFDDEILVRVGREMQPTPKAKALYEPLREVLLTVRGMMEAQPEFDPASTRRGFRLLLSDYATIVFLPRVVRYLGEHAPHTQLATEAIAANSNERMESGEADLVIAPDDWRLMGALRQDEGLNRVPLFSDRFVCVACAAHPELRESLSVEDFCRLPHAVTRFGGNAMTVEEAALRRANIDFEAAVVTPHFSSLLTLLPGTRLIATVQERLFKSLGATLPLRTFDPPVSIPSLNEALMWHPRNDYDPAQVWLRQVFIDIARSM